MDNPLRWIRTDRSFSLPAYVRQALQKLSEEGHIAYIVGGAVRDFLREKETKDFDISTSASPEELCSLFPDAVTVGKAFGVIKVPFSTQAGQRLLEIATFREDLGYRDHRHPRRIRFSGPYEDAQRRDFTINALFYDPKTSRILDCVGGISDLKSQLVRAIGDPGERFQEDALRLLRAVRFTTRLGFSLEPGTAAAVKAKSRLITNISAERIRDELTMMWTGPRPDQSLSLMFDLGLLRHILPELAGLRGVTVSPPYRFEGDLWQQLLRTLRVFEEQNPVRSPTLAWAMALHDVGKPVVFNGHEIEGAKIAARICSRLRLPRADAERIAFMVEEHLKFKDAFKMREATLQRFVLQPGFDELLAFHRADATASDGNLAYYEFCKSRFDAAKNLGDERSSKLIDGHDLIQLGFQPGPHFSEILSTVEDLAIEKKLGSKEEALEYVVKKFVK